MEKLLLVDGHNLLFQMFYGMPSRIVDKNNNPIQGILGFIGALLKIIKKLDPTHLLVIFDGEHQNLRTELLADYKANRQDFSTVPEKENPFSQLEGIYHALNYLHIPYYETTLYEADDVIASYAKQYETQMDVCILSFDSDFFSLITEHTTIYRYRGEKSYLCDRNYIRNRYGIEPCQYVLYKSLTGDSADNIKGVYGIGPKTASRIASTYSTIDNLLVQLETIDSPKLRDKIISSIETLKINEKIISINQVQEMPFLMRELKYSIEPTTTASSVLKAIGIW